MSSLRFVNAAEEGVLDAYFAVAALGGGHTLRLYRTDVEAGLTETQKDALTVAAFTEANFAGYASVNLAGASWTTTPSDPSVAVYARQTFTRSSTGTAQLIYGYYVTLVSGGALQWYEHFDAPISIEFLGDALRVTPQFTLDEGGIVPTGQITGFGGTAAPTGWLLCDGTAVSRTTFAALFAVLGTAYGVGDGSTTFNLPDLRQRFPLGKATEGTGSTLGGTGGTIDHVHNLDTGTSHARVSMLTSAPHARIQRKTVTSWAETHDVTATSGAAGATATTLGAALGGNSDTANPPFQAVNFIVKT